MLYVSTRDRTNSFTAYRALHEERAPDGGLFVPFRIPVCSKEEIQALKEKNFGEIVAQILNLFFSTGLTGWDVDFTVGRNPFRVRTMNHRLVVGELWHNLESDYAYFERSLYNKLCGGGGKQPTDWAKIAVRIAVLFGMFGTFSREGIRELDIAVTVGDFSVPMAAWYARRMGLPIGTIICGCNENGAVWELVHHGEMNTGTAVVHTDLPELDYACPSSVERLIYHAFGINQSLRFVDICKRNAIYTVDDETQRQLSDGFFAAVVSGRRARSVIANIYRSNHYLIDGCAAIAYGSLQDYRSSTGESRGTLLLADRSPMLSVDRLSKILHIPAEELRKNL